MSMTTIKYDDIKEEIDYEKYLTLDLIALFENIRDEYNRPELYNINMNILNNIDKYNQVCYEMQKNYISNINIIPFEQNNISVSIEKSYAIENEDIDSREKSYLYFLNAYNDIDYCRRFNINFIKNIKQMNKHLNLKNAGKFKDRNNDCIISHPKYDILPISHPNINKYLKVLTDFLTYPVGSDYIYIKAILIHIFFEAIHPFSDGNGRIGRFLLNNNINVYLKNPIYLDEEIFDNRDAYYKNLLLFNTNQSQVEVMIWFLERVNATIENNISKCKDTISKSSKLLNYFNDLNIFNREVNHALSLIFCTPYGAGKETIFLFLSSIYKDNRSKQKVIDKLLELQIINQNDEYYYLTKKWENN